MQIGTEKKDKGECQTATEDVGVICQTVGAKEAHAIGDHNSNTGLGRIKTILAESLKANRMLGNELAEGDNRLQNHLDGDRDHNPADCADLIQDVDVEPKQDQ